LNKLRNKISSSTEKAARVLAKTGLSPNAVTALSLVVAFTGPLVAGLWKSGVLVAIVVLASGIMDFLDGALARATGKTSARGGFLDSFADRASEALFAVSFLLLGFDPVLVTAFLAMSFLVSYIRARAESLGVKVEGVGIMERAERTIALIAVAALADFNRGIATLIYVAAAALVALTVVERFVYVWKHLSKEG